MLAGEAKWMKIEVYVKVLLISFGCVQKKDYFCELNNQKTFTLFI